MEFVPLESVKIEPEEELIIETDNKDSIDEPEEVDVKTEFLEENDCDASPASVKDDVDENIENKDESEEEEEVSQHGKITGGEFVLVQSEESNLDLDSNNEEEEERKSGSDSEDKDNMAQHFGAHFLTPMIEMEEGNPEDLESALEAADLDTHTLRGGRIRRVQSEEEEEEEENDNFGMNISDQSEPEEFEEEDENQISAALSSSKSTNSTQIHKCDFCKETLGDSLLLIFHINEKHSDKCIISKEQLEKAVKSSITDNEKKKKEELNKILPGNIQCPMCSCIYVTKIGLEKHLIAFHNVKNVSEVIKSVTRTVTAQKKKLKKRRKRYCSASSSDEDSQDDFFLPSSSESSSEDDDPTWTSGSSRQKRMRTKATASSSSNMSITHKSILSGVPIAPRPPSGIIQKPPTYLAQPISAGVKPMLQLKPESLIKMKSVVNAKLNLHKNTDTGQQKVKLFMSKDGNLRLVGGLLPGQQLVTMPDGTMKIVFTPQLPVPGTLTPVNLDSIPSGITPERLILKTTSTKLLSAKDIPMKRIIMNSTTTQTVSQNNPGLKSLKPLAKTMPSILRSNQKVQNIPTSISNNNSVIEKNNTKTKIPEIISLDPDDEMDSNVETTNLANLPKSVPIVVPSQSKSILKSSLLKGALETKKLAQSVVDLTDSSDQSSSNETDVHKDCCKHDGIASTSDDCKYSFLHKNPVRIKRSRKTSLHSDTEIVILPD